MFKISKVIPNALCYKLKNTSKTKQNVPDPNTHKDSPPYPPKTHPPDPPRNSSKKKRPTNKKAPIHRKPSSGSKFLPNHEPIRTRPGPYPYPDQDSVNSIASSLIFSDDKFKNIKLRPFLTNPDSPGSGTPENQSTSLPTISRHPVRRFKGRIKANIGIAVRVQAVHGGRRSVGGCRRRLSESFVVVKTSADPHRDFKESMVEMIMENNINSRKDLEELLAGYLLLNSDDYHGLIIEVFKQIWVESCVGIRV